MKTTVRYGGKFQPLDSSVGFWLKQHWYGIISKRETAEISENHPTERMELHNNERKYLY